MKNRLMHIPEDQFRRFVSFAQTHPDLLSVHHLLQKLTIFDFVAPVVRRHHPTEILEVGCGLGIHSALLSRFGRVRATELRVPGSFVGAGDAVDDGRTRVLRELGEGEIAFVHNDGRSLPYEDSSFDLVFHNSVIEHVPDIEAFNREIRRILRPNGICICITGTPALCWLRFLLGSVAKLPVNLVLAVAREIIPGSGLARIARWILFRAGVRDGLIRKVESRLTSVGHKIGQLSALAGPGTGDEGDPPDLRPMYPRLQHYIDFPEYNRMVFEEVALELRLTPDQLASRVREHFSGSVLNRILYSLTPRTHGQHYRNWREEKREWSVRKWIERFKSVGLAVEEVLPYRFHHIFEATPRRKWDAYAYYYGARFVHSLLRRRALDPSAGSEIMIVARRLPHRSPNELPNSTG